MLFNQIYRYSKTCSNVSTSRAMDDFSRLKGLKNEGRVRPVRPRDSSVGSFIIAGRGCFEYAGCLALIVDRSMILLS